MAEIPDYIEPSDEELQEARRILFAKDAFDALDEAIAELDRICEEEERILAELRR